MCKLLSPLPGEGDVVCRLREKPQGQGELGKEGWEPDARLCIRLTEGGREAEFSFGFCRKDVGGPGWGDRV